MLFVNPRQVRFGDRVWTDAAMVAVDRTAARLVEDWSDHGPWCTLVDVPEERVIVKVVQTIAGDDIGALALGEEAELTFVTSPTASPRGAREFAATCVIVGVSHEVSVKGGAGRTITLRAVSEDGSTDPVVVGDVGTVGETNETGVGETSDEGGEA